MQKKLHIKKGDTVVVISGNSKGQSGKVLEVDDQRNKMRVQGIALVNRHYKARRQNEKSSIKVFERFIDCSNVRKSA